MEIKNSNNISQLAGERVAKTDAKAKVQGTDLNKSDAAKAKSQESSVNVALSPKAKEMKAAHEKAFQIAMNTPDVRQDRVAELKAKIQNGTYQIEPEKIVDGIYREAIKDHLALTGRE